MSPAEHDLLKDAANLSVLLLGVGLVVSLLAAKVLPGGLTQRYGKIDTERLGPPELGFALVLIALIWGTVIAGGPSQLGEASGIALLLVLLGIVYFLGQIRHHDLVSFFGWRRLSFGKILIWGFSVGLGSFVLSSLLGSALQEVIFKDHLGELPPQEAVQELAKNHDPAFRMMIFVSACIYAPLIEEIIFRGFLYPALKRFTLPLVAAVVVSGLFAAFHANLYALVPLAFFAVILTAVYEVTGCLWVPIMAHAVFNLCNVIATVSRPVASFLP